jgi:hypothetical protein
MPRPQRRLERVRIWLRRGMSSRLLPRRPPLDRRLVQPPPLAEVAVRVGRGSCARPGPGPACADHRHCDAGRRGHDLARGRRIGEAEGGALEARGIDEVPAVRAARGATAGAVAVASAR